MSEHELLTTGWRDIPVSPRMNDKILIRLERAENLRRRRAFFAGILVTGASASVISAAFLFGTPTVTFAQVIDAASKIDSFTVINRRIMGPEKGDGFTITSRVSGQAIRHEVQDAHQAKNTSFSYSDEARFVRYDERFKLVTFDEPRKQSYFGDRIPKISVMIRDLKAAKVETNYPWKGRNVVRFTYHTSKIVPDIDQELLVDPRTMLPIRYSDMHEHRAWGDEFTFDYARVDLKSIAPNYPSDSQVIDHRMERAKIVEIATGSSNQILVAQVSPYEIALVLKRSEIATNGRIHVEITPSIGSKSYSEDMSEFNWGNLRVGNQDLVALRVSDAKLDWDSFHYQKALSGKLKITANGKVHEYLFRDVPIVLASSVVYLNLPFSERFRQFHHSNH